MKLKRISIRNYKALDDVELDVPGDLLFLIGVNGAGKSSVLQALSLVRYFLEGQTTQFFKDRHWDPTSVRPRTVNVAPLRAAASGQGARRISARNFEIALALELAEVSVLWSFTWSYVAERTVRESIWVLDPKLGEPRKLFGFPSEGQGQDHPFDALLRVGDFRLPGSILSLAAPQALTSQDLDIAVLSSLSQWAGGITSLELLSPNAMRGGVRGSYDDIGPRGERLAGFIAGLPPPAKERIVNRMADFYPIRDLNTTRKRAGWIDMKIAEAFRLFGRIDVTHMSDGFLRILALCSIPEFGELASLILLDEVEDGIEPHILPRLIERINEDASAQIVLTSHSPLLINYFEPERTYLLSRDTEGRTIGANLTRVTLFQNGRDFLGSGEIWANAQRASIQSAVRAARIRRRPSRDERSEVLRMLSV